MGNAWSKEMGNAKILLFCSRCDTNHHLLPKWSQAKERNGRGFSTCYSAVKMQDLFKILLRKLSEKCEEEGVDMKEGMLTLICFGSSKHRYSISTCPLSRPRNSVWSPKHLKRLSILQPILKHLNTGKLALKYLPQVQIPVQTPEKSSKPFQKFGCLASSDSNVYQCLWGPPVTLVESHFINVVVLQQNNNKIFFFITEN